LNYNEPVYTAFPRRFADDRAADLGDTAPIGKGLGTEHPLVIALISLRGQILNRILLAMVLFVSSVSVAGAQAGNQPDAGVVLFLIIVGVVVLIIAVAIANKNPEDASISSASTSTAVVPMELSPPVPGGPMHLKIRRTKRQGTFVTKFIFAIDARIEPTTEELDLIDKCGLRNAIVYDSKKRAKHQQAAYDHFDDAVHTPGLGWGSAGRSLMSNARGIGRGMMMALSLRVTINSLMSGVHIECKDLDELMGAEEAIIEACRTLRAYLDVARTFDGREEIIEF
jgi:hypothetical protein